MRHAIIRCSVLCVLLIAAVLKANHVAAVPITFSAAGPNVPSIQDSVDAFRTVGLYRHGVP
jgi:hypothetical protein